MEIWRENEKYLSMPSISKNIIAVLTEVGAGTFSRNIIIILFIFSNLTTQLAQRSTPQQLKMTARKLYHRDQQGVYFRVTMSLS